MNAETLVGVGITGFVCGVATSAYLVYDYLSRTKHELVRDETSRGRYNRMLKKLAWERLCVLPFAVAIGVMAVYGLLTIVGGFIGGLLL